jgi:hypothetical protein
MKRGITMGHLPLGGTKSFLTILALMALASFRRPNFLKPRRAEPQPGGLPAIQPAALDIAA